MQEQGALELEILDGTQKGEIPMYIYIYIHGIPPSWDISILEIIATVRSRFGRDECLKRLQSRIPQFQGNECKKLDEAIVKVTKEGAKVVLEAIQYLKRTDTLNFTELEFSTISCQTLSVSSEDHCVDVGNCGTASHTGSDGSHPSERMSRYGMWHGACGEVVWYGRLPIVDEEANRITMKSIAQDIIDDLIIDDGVPSRGHRLALFDPRFKVGGVGVSTHRVFGHVVVINMATAMLVDDDFCDKNNESCKILEIMCAGREESNAMKSDILATLKDRAERLRRRVIEGPPVISQPTLAAASTQWKDIGICHRCRQEILGGRVVEIPHTTTTTTTTTTSNNKDAKKKQNNKVAAPLPVIKEKKFHSECFVCAFCSQQLISGGYMSVPFAQLNEVIQQEKTDKLPVIGSNHHGDAVDHAALVCQSCYDGFFAPICPHCMQRITDKRSVRFKERFYHIHCLEEEKKKRSTTTDAVASTSLAGKSSTGSLLYNFLFIYTHTHSFILALVYTYTFIYTCSSIHYWYI